MRPIRLTMNGFLSYRDQETIDFTIFDVACITGENGAGKSSILDGMTFALFGKARVNSGDSLINIASETAEVNFEFLLNETHYRVIRKIYRNYKPTESFFHYLDPHTDQFVTLSGTTKTQTDEEIRKRMNMDYETFTTASFFLQGKADSFAKSNPSERKKILGKILRLETWDVYHEKTKSRRTEQNRESKALSDAITVLKTTIAEEPSTLTTIQEKKYQLQTIDDDLANQRDALGNVDRLIKNLESARVEIEMKKRDLTKKELDIVGKKQQVEGKTAQLTKMLELIERGEAIRYDYSLLIDKKNFIIEQDKLKVQIDGWNNEIKGIKQQIQIKENQIQLQINELEDRQIKITQQSNSLPDLREKLQAYQKSSDENESVNQEISIITSQIKGIETFGTNYSKYLDTNSKLNEALRERNDEISKLSADHSSFQTAASQIEEQTKELNVQQARLTALNLKVNNFNALKTSIAQIDLNIQRFDADLAKINTRRNHLTADHSPNCPTCERPLSKAEEEELQQKLSLESAEIRRSIDLAIDEKKEMVSKMLELSVDSAESDPFKSELETTTRLIAALQTKIEINKESMIIWNPEKQARLNELNLPSSEISKLELEKNELSRFLQTEYTKLLPPYQWSDPATSNNQIMDKKRVLTDTIDTLRTKQSELNKLPLLIHRVESEINQIEQALQLWEINDKPKLENFKEQSRSRALVRMELDNIANLAEKIQDTGFNPILIQQTSQYIKEQSERIEREIAVLQNAPSRVNELNTDIDHSQTELNNLNAEADHLRKEITAKIGSLGDEKTLIEQKSVLDDKLRNLDQKKTDLTIEIGREQQKLQDISHKKLSLGVKQSELEQVQRDLTNLEILEKAFGKNGVPALLIEQAKPEIEAEANRILSKLTDGFSIRFQTQKEYKNQKRDDAQETLEIEISDGSGSRDYDTYSGGETFRVNFALRLALSKMLAHRADAKLETLVIDEGFGSQDDDGKQKLIEAIKAIQSEFKMILVVTHLEELKEKFDRRIEVRKEGRTSRIKVS